jgi:hypothetical protein
MWVSMPASMHVVGQAIRLVWLLAIIDWFSWSCTTKAIAPTQASGSCKANLLMRMRHSTCHKPWMLLSIHGSRSCHSSCMQSPTCLGNILSGKLKMVTCMCLHQWLLSYYGWQTLSLQAHTSMRWESTCMHVVEPWLQWVEPSYIQQPSTMYYGWQPLMLWLIQDNNGHWYLCIRLNSDDSSSPLWYKSLSCSNTFIVISVACLRICLMQS